METATAEPSEPGRRQRGADVKPRKRRQQRERDRVLLANSFSHGEVRALLELYQTVLRGGDGRDVARAARLLTVIAKFQRMDVKYKASNR